MSISIMPDKVLQYSGSFCNTVSFAILHLGLVFARLSRGVGWIQHYDVIVFEKFRFHRPQENAKTEFSNFLLWRAFLRSFVFGYCFHRICVDGRPIRKEKVAFSYENGYVWTAPNTCIKREKEYFIRMKWAEKRRNGRVF